MNTKKFCVYELLDKVFWILIMFMPIIIYAVYLHHADTYVAFSSFLGDGLGVVISTDSILYSTFIDLFVVGGGYFELFGSMGILLDILVWIFAVEFAHVLFDALVFIPRWCHQVLNKAVS